MFNDIGNAVFELFGAIVTWVNFFKILKDKKVRGVYYPVWLFYTFWGLWNLWFYPSVNCWWSFSAGIFLVIGNSAWVYMAFKYRKN